MNNAIVVHAIVVDAIVVDAIVVGAIVVHAIVVHAIVVHAIVVHAIKAHAIAVTSEYVPLPILPKITLFNSHHITHFHPKMGHLDFIIFRTWKHYMFTNCLMTQRRRRTFGQCCVRASGPSIVI